MALVLITCEESQTVCKAFRAMGHEAYSNDIQECSGGHPEWHLQMCALEAMRLRPWKLMIGHPPCTYLSNVANRYFHEKYNTQLDLFKGEYGRWERRREAFEFFMKFTETDIPFVCLENPVGILHRWYRKPDQIIHPYYFGDPYKKRTCLWLKGLPTLEPTDMLAPPEPIYFTSTRNKPIQWCESLRMGDKERKKVRSKTFQGIANAMAEQWGPLL
jgi:hypothetical protein